MKITPLVIALLLFSTPTVYAGDPDAPEPATTQPADELVDSIPQAFYVVGAYGFQRNPRMDVQIAMKQAEKENKRILLEVGGNWCVWCEILDKYIQSTPAVAEALEKGFLIVKINVSEENKNEEFLADYPEIPGYPHLFVLEKDGSLLVSQETGSLEEGKGYSDEAWLSFLETWTPAPTEEAAEKSE